MADKKISDMPLLAQADMVGSTDYLPIIDVSAAAAERNKRILANSIVLGALSQNGGSAAISYTPVGTGAVATTAQAKFRETVSAKDFGAVGDGVADDATALLAFFTYLKTNGGWGVIPPGTYKVLSQILTTGASQPYGVMGYGATIKRANNSMGSVVEIRTSDKVQLYGLTIDGSNDTLASGNHGLVILDCNDARLVDLKIQNYKNSAILAYATTAGTISGVVIDSVTVDGRGVANNGILVANLDKSGMRRCRVVGAPGSPGYGLQLKNSVSYGFIEDCYVEGCKGGVAFGNDTASLGVQFSRVTGVTAYNCTQGFVAGYAENCYLSGLLIDMSGALGTNDAIRLETSCNSNSVECVILNPLAGREAIRMASSAGNVIRARYIKKSSGDQVGFDSGCANNVVIIDQISSYALTASVRDDSGTTSNIVYLGKVAAKRFAPDASATPTVNGEMVFEKTSNTSITVKLKGSDGVVRSTSLTLS